MCMICERIQMIKSGTNPYFVKELDTGYVVIGDNQHFKGYTLFLLKEHATELYELSDGIKEKFLLEMTLTAEAAAKAFGAEKMNYECLGNGETHLHWHLFRGWRATSKASERTAKGRSGGIREKKCTLTTPSRASPSWKK